MFEKLFQVVKHRIGAVSFLGDISRRPMGLKLGLSYIARSPAAPYRPSSAYPTTVWLDAAELS
jgi:hypothetical protein